ncbi:MAG: hypothetical protein K8I30_11630 [Anaerolineae bacterium]|nr:hypothetical protein [Anaerolineae bacterium]
MSRLHSAKREVIESRFIFTMYQVLNGPTYSENERPPFWMNEKELFVDIRNMESLPIADFPLIEDFEVRIERDTGRGSIFGYQLWFFSAAHGYIADFPWQNVERAFVRDDFMIPLGGFIQPFRDYEQSWDVVIAEKDDLVYVLEGNFDETGYNSWFKVRKERYLAEWGRAIQACREAFQTNAK